MKTFFANRMFTNTVKLKKYHTGLHWALNTMYLTCLVLPCSMALSFSGWCEGWGEWKVDRDCSRFGSPGLCLPFLPSPSLPSAPLHDSLRVSTLLLFCAPLVSLSPTIPLCSPLSFQACQHPHVGWQLTHSLGDRPPTWAVADMPKCFVKQKKYVEIFHLLGF